MNAVILIISATISILMFDKLNSKYNFFKNIRYKIDDLNEKKERKLRIISYILILTIFGIVQSTEINIIAQGLILGLLLSVRNICFKGSSNEYYNEN